MKSFLKKHWKQLIIVVLAVAFFVAVTQSPASAAWWDSFKPDGDDDKKATAFLLKYGDKMQYSDSVVRSMLHTVVWLLVMGIYKFVDLIENCLDGANLLSLFNFVDGKNAIVHGVYASVMNTVIWGILTLTLALVGYKLMFGKTGDMKNLGVNVMLSVVLLILMPTLFGTGTYSGENFAKSFFNDSKGISANSNKGQKESLAFSLIKSNTTDWIYVSQNNKWDQISKGKSVNEMSESDFRKGTYPLSSLITAKTAENLDTDDGKLLKYHLEKDDKNATKPVKPTALNSWAPKSFQNGYYRFSLTSFIGVIVGLIALAAAYLYNSFVIVKCIIELGVKRIIAPVIFASDVESLQRSKMVLTDIMKGYATIGLTELLMVIFNFWITFVNGKSMNLILKVICYVAGVWVLMQGSETMLRYFGVDVGFQEGRKGIMGAFAMGTAVGKGSKSAKTAVGGVVGAGVATVAGGATGIINGLQKGAGMKLSQSASAAGGSTGSPSESLSERKEDQQRQQDKQQNRDQSQNIQARRPSLVRRAARATGQKIQQSAERQMQKHPVAAKIGGVAGGAAGLGVRAGRKLSGMDQKPPESQQNGDTQMRKLSDASQARSDDVKTNKAVNDPLNGIQKRPNSSLSQKPLEQQQEVRQEQEHQPENAQEALSQKQQEQASQTQEDHRQAEQEQEVTPASQQTEAQQEQESLSHKQAEAPQEAVQAESPTEATQPQEVQAQEAVEQRTEAPQAAEATQAEKPVKATGQQAETLMEATPVSQPKDYSQYIKGDVTPTTVPEATVQTPQVPQSNGNTTVTAQTTTTTQQQSVQHPKNVQKRPETPPTDPVLNDPWGGVDNNRS